MISIRRLLTRRLLGTTLGLLTVGLTALLALACYAVIHQFDVALRTKALAVSTVAVVTPETVRVEFGVSPPGEPSTAGDSSGGVRPSRSHRTRNNAKAAKPRRAVWQVRFITHP